MLKFNLILSSTPTVILSGYIIPQISHVNIHTFSSIKSVSSSFVVDSHSGCHKNSSVYIEAAVLRGLEL